MRYLVPLEDELGSMSRVSPHFGRSPYFAIIALNSSKGAVEAEIESILDRGEAGGSGIVEFIGKLGVDAVIVKGIGVRALKTLQGMGVSVYRTSSDTLHEVMKEIAEGRLALFDSGEACEGRSCRGGQVRRCE